MARETISAWQARRQFGRVLREVSRGNTFVVESHGEPIAEVVPLAEADRKEEARRTMFAIMDKAAATAGLSPEEADRLANEAVAAVRAERARR
ncbi:MAG: type II toxin-antitoxin system Phd/YefM family antitoxin [Thermomicrobiales bacterium]